MKLGSALGAPSGRQFCLVLEIGWSLAQTPLPPRDPLINRDQGRRSLFLRGDHHGFPNRPILAKPETL